MKKVRKPLVKKETYCLSKIQKETLRETFLFHLNKALAGKNSKIVDGGGVAINKIIDDADKALLLKHTVDNLPN